MTNEWRVLAMPDARIAGMKCTEKYVMLLKSSPAQVHSPTSRRHIHSQMFVQQLLQPHESLPVQL